MRFCEILIASIFTEMLRQVVTRAYLMRRIKARNAVPLNPRDPPIHWPMPYDACADLVSAVRIWMQWFTFIFPNHNLQFMENAPATLMPYFATIQVTWGNQI